MKISNLPTPNNATDILERGLSLLRKYWKFDSFRSIQGDIILSVCRGKDTLGLMPTGGGKSITFQIPSLLLPGTCIVVTPLIALMKDQVARLKQMGIKATAIYSGMTRDDIIRSLENCILGEYKFLYISPERIKSELFQAKLAHINVNLITVDEAHCISQWGYDFRPSYLQISLLRKLKPEAPVLALTASATPAVVRDIQDKLQFKSDNVFRMSFDRPNLVYSVRNVENKDTALIDILLNTTGSVIVYTRNREKTIETAKLLNKNNIKALAYHAGMNAVDKDTRQQLWHSGLVRVMVSTNAFGMGIDKPDVRLVIHIGVPDSLEAYYQEAGRAGRDNKPAQAILLKGRYDIANLKRHIDTAFPSKDFIRNIYLKLCYYYELAIGDGNMLRKEFNLSHFCKQYDLFSLPVLSAFRILENAGLVQYSEPEDCVSCVKILVNRDRLYSINNLSNDCEIVLKTLLRSYNGLFADLMPIEEVVIAQRSNLAPQTVYQNLQLLNSLGIIYYIPFKHTAHITFLQRRVDIEDIFFTPQVYQHRRQDLVRRVEAMINYISSTGICRSRILQEYFGDTNATNCGKCDNCIRNGYSASQNIGPLVEHASIAIVKLLGDNNKHPYTELKDLPFPNDAIKQALENLLNENEIILNDGCFSLN